MSDPEDDDLFEGGETVDSLHTEITQQLRQRILTGDLPPGSRILERDLAESFGISRTPLREAIKVLAAEELVVLQPHRGSLVAPLDLRDIDESYEVLEAFEETIGLLAAERATDAEIAALSDRHADMVAALSDGDVRAYLACNQEVHLGLAEATHNPILAATYAQSLRKTFRACFITYGQTMLVDGSLGDHERILALLTARDGPRLGTALLEHCRTVHRAVIAEARAWAAENKVPA